MLRNIDLEFYGVFIVLSWIFRFYRVATPLISLTRVLVLPPLGMTLWRLICILTAQTITYKVVKNAYDNYMHLLVPVSLRWSMALVLDPIGCWDFENNPNVERKHIPMSLSCIDVSNPSFLVLQMSNPFPLLVLPLPMTSVLSITQMRP